MAVPSSQTSRLYRTTLDDDPACEQCGWYGYRKVTVLMRINQSKAATQGQISMKLNTLP